MNERNGYQVKRPIFEENQFAEVYELPRDSPSTTDLCRSYIKRSCQLSPTAFLGFFTSFFPFLRWLPKYRWRDYFMKDIAGGLTVGIMQIPQGMAYAMLTSLPPVFGLYVSFIPVLAYFIFGTSRHVSIGTFAIVCLMVGEVIDNNFARVTLSSDMAINASALNSSTETASEANEVSKKVQIAIALALTVGVIQIIMGFARLGFVTVFLSDPMVSGFTTGAAFHIFSSQVRHFLGIKLPDSKTRGFFTLFKIYYYLFEHIEEASLGALIIGLVCTLLLFGIKYGNEKLKGKLKFPIPGELIVVVLGTGISYGVNVHARFHVPILENVPKGLPPPSVPSLSLVQTLVVQSFTIAVVSFAINVSLAKSFAKKNSYTIDANQELIAYGLANVVGSFFSCFPSAVSLSRSMIQENLASTQMAGVMSVVLVVLVLLSMAPLFEPLPKAVLAAIVLVALKGLFKQFKVLRLLWKINKTDAVVWFSSFLAVFLLGVDYGLALGIAFTLLSTVIRTSRPSSCVLGQVPGMDIYRNSDKYDVRKVPGLEIFRYDSSLCYANVEHFRETLFASTIDPRLLSTKFEKENASDHSASDTDVSDSDSMETKVAKEVKVEIKDCKEKTRKRSSSQSTPSNSVDIIMNRNANGMVTPLDDENDSHSYVYAVILDCSFMAFSDSMGVATLANIAMEYNRVKVAFYLCSCSENFFETLEAGGFMDVHGDSRVFLTVHDAVLTVQKKRAKGIFPDPPSLGSFTMRCESPTVIVKPSSSMEPKPFQEALKYITKEI